MADSEEKNASEATEQELEEKINAYRKLIDRLKTEREHVEKELSDEYRNARRYVRSHPEEGVLLSFAGGILLGILLGRLGR